MTEDSEKSSNTDRIFSLVFVVGFVHLVAAVPVGIIFGASNGWLAGTVGMTVIFLGLLGKIGMDHGG